MLDLHLSLLILTAVIFLFLIFALNEILYRPLLGFIDTRKKSMENDLNNISGNDEAVQSALKEANEIISGAKGQAFKIREDATKIAKQSAAEELGTNKGKLEELYALFLKDLGKRKTKLKKDLTGDLSLYQQNLQDKLKAI